MSFITNALNGLIGDLSGSNYNANQVGNYYSNAMGDLVGATGSPAAQQFGQEQSAALQPLFAQQNANLAAKEAAMGTTNSGAAKNDYGNLSADQAATLARAIAPLYRTALGQYGAIAGQGAGAQAHQYGQSLQDFMSAASSAGAGAGTGGAGAAAGSYGG